MSTTENGIDLAAIGAERDRIREIDGFPYDQYIVPGLIAMSMAQAAYANNSSSVSVRMTPACRKSASTAISPATMLPV